jgi:hypothetical protein
MAQNAGFKWDKAVEEWREYKRRQNTEGDGIE